MPKGDPNGGRPRRIDKATEDILRAGLREARISPRRALPEVVPFLLHRVEETLSREALPPGMTPQEHRSRVERNTALALVLFWRADFLTDGDDTRTDRLIEAFRLEGERRRHVKGG